MTTTTDGTATTPDTILYTARATAKGGRSGHSATDDGMVDVALTAPKELGGPGTGTNPEQLFAVGYAACFNGALALVAKKQGIDASESRVRANVGFGPEGESYAITVDLEAEVPGVDLEQAQQLVEAAHQVCPYSNATRGNIEVALDVV